MFLEQFPWFIATFYSSMPSQQNKNLAKYGENVDGHGVPFTIIFYVNFKVFKTLQNSTFEAENMIESTPNQE